MHLYKSLDMIGISKTPCEVSCPNSISEGMNEWKAAE